MLLHAVLAFALVQTLVLGALLWLWSDRVPGARLLLWFLGGVALWVLGNELPNWFGPEWGPLALGLLALAPVVSAVFFHFCVVLCRSPMPRGYIVAGYVVCTAATLVAEFTNPAHLVIRPHIGYIAVPHTSGIVASVLTTRVAGTDRSSSGATVRRVRVGFMGAAFRRVGVWGGQQTVGRSGRNLTAHPRLSLRDHRVPEPGHEHAFIQEHIAHLDCRRCLADDDRDDRRFAGQGLETRVKKLISEVARVVAEPTHALGMRFDELDRGDRAGRDRGRQRVGEELRP